MREKLELIGPFIPLPSSGSPPSEEMDMMPIPIDGSPKAASAPEVLDVQSLASIENEGRTSGLEVSPHTLVGVELPRFSGNSLTDMSMPSLTVEPPAPVPTPVEAPTPPPASMAERGVPYVVAAMASVLACLAFMIV